MAGVSKTPLSKKLGIQSEAGPSKPTASKPTVVAVSKSSAHRFSKEEQESITLRAGIGVEGDAHAGSTVKHRSRVTADPKQPNLRQVHLIHHELLDELRQKGFDVSPGSLGENVTTRGLDILSLPRATKLHIGASAVIEITGLRNPCKQLDGYQKGLTAAVLERSESGELIRKSGIMAIVAAGGEVTAGDEIEVELPPEPHHPLELV